MEERGVLEFQGNRYAQHLHGTLVPCFEGKGINTFIDNQLERGHHISDSLVKVIQDSRILIVIFSADYVGSSSCLEELVNILECQKLRGQLVLPMFYNINPSDVEKQTGCYADSLAELEAQLKVKAEKMKEWRLALTEASTLFGWHLDYGPEPELIQTIVGKVSMELNQVPLHVVGHPVSLESHIQEMINMLSFGTDEAQFVRIHGLGGIGKTTIAKAIFNIIVVRFEGSCFLANVREISEEKKGLLQLQETLLKEILRDERITLTNRDRGINVMKERLCCKRVLIVIDDVNELQQLKTLVGALSWFGPRSRIIITARDEHLLKAHGVKRIHYVKELRRDYALELFSWNAFKKPQPDEDYLELSRSMIEYAKGLPLALVVLGAFLSDRSKPEWDSQLLNLKRNPNKKVNDILKISFDGLEDYEKNIFLHITCFFKRKYKDDVMRILDACDLNPTIGVKVLAEKSLIRIEGLTFEMHDLVQAMGRQIVNNESPNVWERSRLWNQDDIRQVLLESEDMSLPSTFQARKLVALHLHRSGIAYLGAGFRNFVNLKDLNVHRCPCLRKIPDFSMMTNLKSLSLECCINLVEVHESVRYHNTLDFLSIVLCDRLEVLPSRFQLRFLCTFVIRDCKRLEIFPEIVEEMTCLEKIDLRLL